MSCKEDEKIITLCTLFPLCLKQALVDWRLDVLVLVQFLDDCPILELQCTKSICTFGTRTIQDKLVALAEIDYPSFMLYIRDVLKRVKKPTDNTSIPSLVEYWLVARTISNFLTLTRSGKAAELSFAPACNSARVTTWPSKRWDFRTLKRAVVSSQCCQNCSPRGSAGFV